MQQKITQQILQNVAITREKKKLPLVPRPICGWWSDEGRRRQLVKFIPFMARCRVPGWGTGNFNSYFDLDPIFIRYAREKPKKSEEKKQKRAKRDEAQHSMKVALKF